jgi:hypothetical protein
MKKLFLSVMIILPATLLSQTVSGLKVETAAGSPSTVTFDVEWNKAALDLITPWLDSMWVFVDYNKNGAMTRLELSGGTLTAHSANTVTPSPLSPDAGTVIKLAGNDKGVWVVGDARTNAAGGFAFSATVQLYTKETDITIAGACAYVSTYPPLGEWLSDTRLGFTGTPWYEVTLIPDGGGAATTVETGSTFLLPCSYTMSSFTDATGAPGRIKCIASTDIYTLTASAAEFCPGDAVTFALDNTTPGRMYQLYKDGVAVMDVLTGTGSAETFTGAFAGAGEYTAWVKDDGANCAAAMTGTHAVGESPKPTGLTLITTFEAAAVCEGESATLTASATNGYEYSLDNSSWQSSTTFSVKPGIGGTTYPLYVKSAMGCVASEMNALTVAVNPLPDAPTDASADSRCGPGTVMFGATVPEGYTIDWYTTPEGTTMVSDGNGATSFSSSINASTTYYAQARNTITGCVSATRLEVGAIMNPIPGMPSIGGSGARCNSASLSAVRGTNGTGIRWWDGSTVTPRTVTASGNYSAVTTSDAGCVSDARTVSVTITTQLGANGEPATACGCGSGLKDCSGTCVPNNYAPCGGTPGWCPTYTEMIDSGDAYDNGKKNFADAKAYCVARGMRMANYGELCFAKQYKSEYFTGGGQYYWGPSDNSNLQETRAVRTSDFNHSDVYPETSLYPFKCVK